MEIKVTLDKEEVISKIAEAERKVPGANRYILKLICLDIINISVKEFLSGPKGPTHLARKTGNLAQSLDYNVIGDWNAEVFTNLPYAAIHEFGGTIPAVSGKYMHFFTNSGDEVFTMKHKAFNIKARPYLKPAIDEEFNSGRAMQIVEKVLIDKLGGERA
jgi:phage gpG-like protein